MKCGQNVTQVKECQAKVYVPSAFSPNGDGINPVFIPLFSNDYEISDLRLSIFNRRGQLVFQTHSANTIGWDGKVKGIPANQGTYLWNLEFGYLLEDEIIRQSKSGEVVLLR